MLRTGAFLTAVSLLSAVRANFHLVLEPSLLENNITTANLRTHAEVLQGIADNASGTRVFGSPGYNSSVDYIWNLLEATRAYDLEKQTFPYLFTQVLDEALTANDAPVDIVSLVYTPSTGPDGITAPLVYIPDQDAAPSGGCTAADFAGIDVTGKIALIQRGACTFAIKTTNAKNAGAVGVIIYNNAAGTIAGTLGGPGPDYVPVGGITLADGQALVDRLATGEAITVKLTLDILEEQRYSANIIATTRAGTKDNVVFVGSHLDSVEAGPGLNDNGSGSISLLEIALQLTQYQITNAVRFGWWTAEEFGLVGSEYYVEHLPESERAKIALYLNFDMVASPNYVIAVYDGDDSAGQNPNGPGPAGSATIETVFNGYFAQRNIPSVPTAFSGRSDYGPFIAVGIPAGGLFTGAEGIKTAEQAVLFGGSAGVAFDVNYHQVGDTIDNLNFDAFTINAKAAAWTIGRFILSTHDVKREQEAAAASGGVRRRGEAGPLDSLVIEGVHPAHEEHYTNVAI